MATKNFALSAAAAALLTVAGVASSQAADAIVDVPPTPPAAPMEVAPVASWGGFYAGLQAGYGFGGDATVDGAEYDIDGFVGGAFAGYNVQSGPWVFGLEGDVNYNGIETDTAAATVEGGVDGSLRARAGYEVFNNVLLYGTAGGAAGRFEASQGGFSDDQTHLGWTAGAGTDVKLTEKSFARLEYRYTDYGSETYDLAAPTEVDVNSHKVMVGFGMQF
ncbi:outer membrane protein [Nitratireductor basaltis]|uniref:Porin n=1 Tax=Nitratireductor basaltis TaxID=472175 RepID=A0A084UC32_9HYPH|nr:outer membrane protein [Nitratireductor basaltis]KFB10518.1 Porin [Nitratireductor basaltis]